MLVFRLQFLQVPVVYGCVIIVRSNLEQMTTISQHQYVHTSQVDV
jgi:hypothetical protein